MGKGYTTEQFHRTRLMETRDQISQQLRDLADRLDREQVRELDDEENTAHRYIQFVDSIEHEIRWGVANLATHKLYTSLATLAYTETANALRQED